MTLGYRNVHHAFGRAPLLKDVSLTAHAGEVTCLLGPSGCGKTTLLRITAGLIPLQKGRIVLDGAVMAATGVHPPPEKRPVGLVFQEGALFPHLSVNKNVGFALSGGSQARVSALLEQVGLAGFGERYPHTLSGGQQQRIALARALAPEPRVLLLDEPFANIDITLRRQLREDMRPVLRDSGAVTVLVTHDPLEALDMADQIAVMEEGRIVQAGAPDALYDAPASASVAALIGGAQEVPAEVTDSGLKTAFGVWPTTCLTSRPETSSLTLMVKPCAVQVAAGETCHVVDVRLGGEMARVFLSARNGDRLVLEQPRTELPPVGAVVSVAVKPASVYAFPLTRS